jgi:hypothetical protein
MTTKHHGFFTNPYLLLTLTALFWSGNMVVGRGIRTDVPPMALAFWRWAIAFALVLPLALPHLKSQWPLLKQGLEAGTDPRRDRRRRLQHLRLHRPAIHVGNQRSVAQLLHPGRHHRHFLGLSRQAPEAAEGLGVVISLCGALTIVARGELQYSADPPQPQYRRCLDARRRLVWALYTVGLAWRPSRRASDADARRHDQPSVSPPCPGLSVGNGPAGGTSTFISARSPRSPMSASSRAFSATSSTTAALPKSAPTRPACSST